ncbi:hypothetical protein [Bacillus wiedmannii]|uniref:hypothetical protein n=1 Tax=Bacillus wiedmannii TaxID=1890302 RepID=UPI000BF0D411|nr:hypothetical protein [Bacillus wiedmannii]PEM10777.1 hypothetical protein CN610_12695 [Bacillus wiedmannii]
MKIIYFYDRETGDYTGSKTLSTTYKALNKLTSTKETREIPTIVNVKNTHKYLDENNIYQEEEIEYGVLEYKKVELIYSYLAPDGYTERYEYPEFSTDIPVPDSYLQPVWDGNQWIETAQQEEVSETK